jgi:hypothetical protein
MEIQLTPKDQVRLADLAHKTGRAENEIVQEVMGSYLDGLDEVRNLLDQRLDDIESGRVIPLTSEQARENLQRRKIAFSPTALSACCTEDATRIGLRRF